MRHEQRALGTRAASADDFVERRIVLATRLTFGPQIRGRALGTRGMIPACLHEAHEVLDAIVGAEAVFDELGEQQGCFPQLFDDARLVAHSRPPSSALNPAFPVEHEGSELEELNVPLDTVPVVAMSSPQDGRVFFLAHFPSLRIIGHDEPMDVSVIDQLSIE
jgi:hypothetical protein